MTSLRENDANENPKCTKDIAADVAKISAADKYYTSEHASSDWGA